MTHATSSATFSSSSGALVVSRGRDLSGTESKTRRAVGQALGHNENVSAQVIDAISPVASRMTDADLSMAIRFLQMEQQRRALGKMEGIVVEFRGALSGQKWSELEGLKRKLEREFGDSKNDVLVALKTDIYHAMQDACKLYGKILDRPGMDAIYNVIAGSPLVLEGIESLLAEFKKMEHGRTLCLEGICHLLGKDQSVDNLEMVEMRSKVVAEELKKRSYSRENLRLILGSGPVFFLSHGVDQFKFPGYEEARNAFIEKFQETYDSMHLFEFFRLTPHQLPPDAWKIFDAIKYDRLNGLVRSHVEKCPKSDIQQALLKRFKVKY